MDEQDHSAPSPEPADNPYAPPVDPGRGPGDAGAALPPGYRSPAPRVFGILSLVFAGMTVISLVFGGAMQLVGRHSEAYRSLMTRGLPNQDDKKQAYEDYHAATHGSAMASIAVYGVMSVLLAFVGLGQVRYRRWARRWTNVWAVAALAVLVGMLVMNQLLVVPATEQFFEAMKEASPTGSLEARMNQWMRSVFGGGFSVATTLVSYAPYPALLLYVFNRRAVKASLTT